MNKKILYLSRGRGYGHAIVDRVVADNIISKIPNVEIIFSSYGEGKSVLSRSNYPIIDLNISVEEEFSPVITREIYNAYNIVKPDLIISHEIFYAIPFAKIAQLPSLFITHWFFEQITNDDFCLYLSKLMGSADIIAMIDCKEFHLPPPHLQDKTHFVGPVLRIDSLQGDEPNISINKRNYIVINIGGRIEANAKLIEFILICLKKINWTGTYGDIILFVGERKEYFEEFANKINLSAIVMDFSEKILQLQRESVFVIGRGSFTILSELAALGVPSLHILFEDNPVDKFHAENFSLLGTAKICKYKEITQETFISTIKDTYIWAQNEREKVYKSGSLYRTNGAEKVCELTSRLVNRIQMQNN
ncbi:glycosyltransferase [Lederbergia ruris]|uniref:glycosyltransferase n=1 Tax=Lederbergia ruris TaxID=217495 RepID=UPI0039A15334